MALVFLLRMAPGLASKITFPNRLFKFQNFAHNLNQGLQFLSNILFLNVPQFLELRIS